jgi:hypothetical protein
VNTRTFCHPPFSRPPSIFLNPGWSLVSSWIVLRFEQPAF